MKLKLLIIGCILLAVWQLRPLFYIDPQYGSVNKKVVEFAMTNCQFGFRPCDGQILIKEVTDFAWDEAYLIPMQFKGETDIPLKTMPSVHFSVLDMLKMVFFYKGTKVNSESYVYTAPGFDIDIVDAANQILILDNLPWKARHDVYFRCTPEKSSFKIQKLSSAEKQWPGKVVLVVPEGCESMKKLGQF